MRNDDWNDDFDPGDEPIAAPEPPAPPVPPPPRPAARPSLAVLIPSMTMETEAEAATPPQKVPLRVKLPIYLIAIVSIGLMCVMFFTIILLIAGR